MATPRLFVDIKLTPGESLTLPKAPAHHIATVLRRKVGDEVILFNGDGGEYLCQLEQADRKSVIVQVSAFNPDDRTPPLSIHLGMCILKKDPMDAVLGRVVELGVQEITPIISDHCAVSAKMIKSRQAHWQAVIVSSCEQCGLNRLPLLHEPVATDTWLEQTAADRKIIALPGAGQLSAGESTNSVSLLVGPEGGFSDREVDLAGARGYQPATLGDRILRAETAPAVAISVLHRVWGDF